MAGFDDFLPSGKFFTSRTLPAIATGIGGILGARSAGRAADANTDAANRAAGLSERQFDITRADLAPFREQGVNALNQFAADNLGPLEETPEFRFALEQGVNALDRSAAARGKLLSGQQVKAVQRFGTGLGNQFAGQQQNRLAALAGIGQTATANTGQFGANASSNIGNALLAGGDARASGFVGQSNAINDSINNLLLFNALQNQN